MVNTSTLHFRCLKKVIHHIDSENEWLLLSASFTAKFELIFVLILENMRSACFHVTISGNFECFQYFAFETNFPENENLKIENTSFPYKTAISEANVKINRMVSGKLIYHKEWSFASDHFAFFKILFQFKNLLKRVDPNVHIHIFQKRWSFIWECFSLGVSINTRFFFTGYKSVDILFSTLTFCAAFLPILLIRGWNLNSLLIITSNIFFSQLFGRVV